MSIITISRGTFGGGKAVAEALADRLDYHCLSRETVAEDAANQFGIPVKALHDTILETPGFFNKQIATRISNLKYIRTALLERCKDYRVVYHGWGGHLLLQNIPGLLRVRITAGLEYRINELLKREQVTRDAAVSIIANMDKNRTQWAKELWGVNWNDPSLFDLSLNLDTISVESAVDVVSQVRKLDEFKETAESRKRFRDQYLATKIWVALLTNKPTRGARIEITAKDEAVTITGEVGSMKMVDAIIAIAEQVEGVKSVNNRLAVGSSWMW